jgi:hypothetical protein
MKAKGIRRQGARKFSRIPVHAFADVQRRNDERILGLSRGNELVRYSIRGAEDCGKTGLLGEGLRVFNCFPDRNIVGKQVRRIEDSLLDKIK